MSAPEPIWKPRQTWTLPPPKAVERRYPHLKALILAGVIFPPLVAFGFSAAFGSRSEAIAAEMKVVAAAVAIPPPAAKRKGTELRSIPCPGDFRSDLVSAFREGIGSEAVQLETEEEQDLFDRLRESPASEKSLSGLSFFRIESRGDGVEVHRVQGSRSPWVLLLKKTLDQWRVVGVRPTEALLEEAAAPVDPAVSALGTLLESSDAEVRRAAAEALKALEAEKK